MKKLQMAVAVVKIWPFFDEEDIEICNLLHFLIFCESKSVWNKAWLELKIHCLLLKAVLMMGKLSNCIAINGIVLDCINAN